VRKLYEDSAVPVREIALIAGVSERTLYKYVARHGWKKRYRMLPRGEAAARANRGRHMEPSADSQAVLSPVKGAGGRFICRDDREMPVAAGLKATDPAAAMRAAARCGGVARLSARAQAQARAEADEAQRFERQIRANHAVGIALKNLREYREECGRSRPQRHAPEFASSVHARNKRRIPSSG
jgi:hypothetical protein